MEVRIRIGTFDFLSAPDRNPRLISIAASPPRLEKHFNEKLGCRGGGGLEYFQDKTEGAKLKSRASEP